MEDFLAFLKADNWNGTHVRRKMKKYATLVRRMGGSLNKTYSTLAQTWTREHGRYWLRDRNIRRVIQYYGGEEQRTDAWHARRSQMITASEVGYIVEGTPSQRHEILLRKVSPVTSESKDMRGIRNPLVWGTVLEPIAKRVYERDTNCTIRDVTCVQHRNVSFLGASPDGIIQCPGDRERHNSLVEFKCPISRKPNGTVPRQYYHQMQLQMECAGVDECEYVEFVFRQVHYSEWMDHKGEKGMLAIYETGKIEEWNDAPRAIEGGDLFYWILIEVHRDLVEKDKDWLTIHLPVLTEFWNEVLLHRAAGTIPSKSGILKMDI